MTDRKLAFIDFVSAATFWHAYAVTQGRAQPGENWIESRASEPFGRSRLTGAANGVCGSEDLRGIGIEIPPAAQSGLARVEVAGIPVPLPLHVTVADKSRQTHSPHVVRHLCSGTLPGGSFRRVGPGVLVASPELTFVRMAALLDIEDLVEYGFMLCGLYSLTRDGAVARSAPLTTTARLSNYLGRCGASVAARAARRALRSMADRCASPREAQSCMLLCMPRLLGGLAYEMPLLNHRIDVPANSGLGMGHFTPDFFWPAHRLVVEYDGRAAHPDPQRDALRRNMAQALGYKTFTLVSAHFRNSASFGAAAEEIRRALGARSHVPTPEERSRQLALQVRLLGAGHDSRWVGLLEEGMVLR